MVLDGQRARVDFALTPVARKLINVNPNTISWIGLILALVCGVIFYFSGREGCDWLLVVGAVMVIVSGYFDALVFMIGGIAFCATWCDPYLGMLALVGVLLTSYMGTQAQAIGAPRLYAGLLGRADRVVLSTLFPLIQFISIVCFDVTYLDIAGVQISWLEIMMLWFAVVGNATAIQRAIITWRNLGKMYPDSGEGKDGEE